MKGKRERDYIALHENILRGLVEMTLESGSACITISKLAARLGMDMRTVRAHLKIVEADNVGVFVSTEQKEFCTKQGIIMLARKLGVKEIADE